jgi:HD-GYP domain-containing protein (c-di-GMP phosphodiesterase class II)
MDHKSLFTRRDTLERLNDNCTLSEKLSYIHNIIRQRYHFIDRIAVAVYDTKTDQLKTFVHYSNGAEPLSHYQARLSDSHSLREIVRNGRPRVINDLAIFNDSDKSHSKQILAQGYAASYTMPFYRKGELFGFIFFNASRSGVFEEEVLHYLDLFGHLLSLSVIDELQQFTTLHAAVKTVRGITHHRDNETGGHLDRMSRYARLIAEKLAPELGFSDEYVEQIFRFAPLHDIGKVAIPDGILLKRGALDEEEFAVMKTHTVKGREIIEEMLQHFGLDGPDYSRMLRHITQHHHEALNGEGYPSGLLGDDIPIEARIIAVADVFDALTSSRPYKEAWGNADAFAKLRELSGVQLDAACVEALLSQPQEIEGIQYLFTEDRLG